MSSVNTIVREILSDGIDRKYRGRAPSVHRRRRSRKSQRTLKWTYSAEDTNLPMVNASDNKIFLGASDYDDLVMSELFASRAGSNRDTFTKETTVIAPKVKWFRWLETHFHNEDFTITQLGNNSGLVVGVGTENFIKYSINSNSLTVKAYGDLEFVNNWIETVEAHFSVVTSYIEWMYAADGSAVNVPLNIERLPIEEMYPFLKGESLASYYDRYLESPANILLLIGPPGTGKTTFIRGLLAHSQSSAIVTYDASILEKDYVFARFIEGDDDVMVLEDSDAFLKSRSDGNTMMHRFLNVGDGLVTTKGKKMIFSTNLPSVRDIDSALIRPGRCFDILTFAELTKSEAEALAVKLDVKLTENKDRYSIAELFNEQLNKPKERKIGFV